MKHISAMTSQTNVPWQLPTCWYWQDNNNTCSMVLSSSSNSSPPLLPFSDLKHKVPILLPSCSLAFHSKIHPECLKSVKRIMPWGGQKKNIAMSTNLYLTWAWASFKLSPQLVLGSLCLLHWNPPSRGPRVEERWLLLSPPPAATTHGRRVSDTESQPEGRDPTAGWG